MFEKTINKCLIKYLPSIEDRITASVADKLSSIIDQRTATTLKVLTDLTSDLKNTLTVLSNTRNEVKTLQAEISGFKVTVEMLKISKTDSEILTRTNFDPSEFGLISKEDLEADDEILTKQNFDPAEFDLMVANDFSPSDYDILTNDDGFITADQAEELIASVIKESEDVKAILGEVVSETIKEAFCK